MGEEKLKNHPRKFLFFLWKTRCLLSRKWTIKKMAFWVMLKIYDEEELGVLNLGICSIDCSIICWYNSEQWPARSNQRFIICYWTAVKASSKEKKNTNQKRGGLEISERERADMNSTFNREVSFKHKKIWMHAHIIFLLKNSFFCMCVCVCVCALIILVCVSMCVFMQWCQGSV